MAPSQGGDVARGPLREGETSPGEGASPFVPCAAGFLSSRPWDVSRLCSRPGGRQARERGLFSGSGHGRPTARPALSPEAGRPGRLLVRVSLESGSRTPGPPQASPHFSCRCLSKVVRPLGFPLSGKAVLNLSRLAARKPNTKTLQHKNTRFMLLLT